MRPNLCSFCKGRLHQKETEFMGRVTNQIIVIKDVPAWICKNCGEAYFTPETSRKIDVVMKQFHKGRIQAQPLTAGEISLNSVLAETN